MKRRPFLLASLCVVAGLTASIVNTALAAAPARAALAAKSPDDFETLSARISPAIVTIKCVMKIEAGGRDQEQQAEVFGVMMDAKGLVLVSNVQMGGYAKILARRGGGDLTITPTKIKVLIGEDTEGVDAKLVARDSELDLAWVRIDKPSDKPYAFVDFSQNSAAKLGERLYSIDRLSKFFGRIPVVGETQVGAIAKQPRALLIPTQTSTAFCVPFFNAGGKCVGVTVLQMPSQEDNEADDGGNAGFRGAVILPASEIVGATERAMKSASENADAATVKSDTKPAPDAAPAAPAPAPMGEQKPPAQPK